MTQGGGRYECDDIDDREAGWRQSEYDRNRRYGQSQEYYDYGGGGHGSSARGGWQGRNTGSRGSEWNRMGHYGEEGRWDNDDMRSTASSRGTYAGPDGYYRLSGNYSSGDYYRPSHGDSGNRPMRGNPYGYGGDGQYGNRHNERGFMDRAGDEVASWFGDEDARRRREQDEHRGRGPKGYARSDERIREDVSDRLTDDGWLDASDIEVQVSNREVTLTGAVNSREDKRRAEDLAETVSGIQHVQNNLRVKNRQGAGNATLVAGTGANQGPTATGAQAGKNKI